MKHFTMGQYFNRMNIVLMFLLLIPILTFIVAYTVITADVSFVEFPNVTEALAGVAMVMWLINFFFFNKKIKSARNDQGLGSKLQKYFQLTIVRYLLFEFLSFLLVVAFYFTKDDLITALFAINMVLCALLWPLPSKVCRDLKLRGDEREMVYFKKDEF